MRIGYSLKSSKYLAVTLYSKVYNPGREMGYEWVLVYRRARLHCFYIIQKTPDLEYNPLNTDIIGHLGFALIPRRGKSEFRRFSTRINLSG